MQRLRLVVKEKQVLETTRKECEKDDGWSCGMYPEKEPSRPTKAVKTASTKPTTATQATSKK
jgi:hypothetical protein